MRMFWQRGYEGVGISDLTKAIGIAPPSLYAAFGSKAGLYREALERYGRLPGALDGLASSDDLNAALEGMFRAAIDAVTCFPTERGCMIFSAMLQCADVHQELANDLMRLRAKIREAIALELERWLPTERAQALARYCATVLQGLSVSSCDGASRDELLQVVEVSMCGLRAQIG